MYPEDGRYTLLGNVGIYLPNYMASLSKVRQSLKKGRIYVCYFDSSGARGGAVG